MAASTRAPGLTLGTNQSQTLNEAVAVFDVSLADETELAATKTETALDLGAPGILSLKLDVTAASGTSPTLDAVVKTSADDGATDTYRTAATFTQATGVTSERQSFIVDRWVKLALTIGGTTPKFTFTANGQIKR